MVKHRTNRTSCTYKCHHLITFTFSRRFYSSDLQRFIHTPTAESTMRGDSQLVRRGKVLLRDTSPPALPPELSRLLLSLNRMERLAWRCIIHSIKPQQEIKKATFVTLPAHCHNLNCYSANCYTVNCYTARKWLAYTAQMYHVQGRNTTGVYGRIGKQGRTKKHTCTHNCAKMNQPVLRSETGRMMCGAPNTTHLFPYTLQMQTLFLNKP